MTRMPDAAQSPRSLDNMSHDELMKWMNRLRIHHSIYEIARRITPRKPESLASIVRTLNGGNYVSFCSYANLLIEQKIDGHLVEIFRGITSDDFTRRIFFFGDFKITYLDDTVYSLADVQRDARRAAALKSVSDIAPVRGEPGRIEVEVKGWKA